jgi:hypothetical protein
MMKRFSTEYRHTDGTRWIGPDFYAESFEEAQAAAFEYPVQPIIVIGEHVETIAADPDIQVRVKTPGPQTVH